MPRSRRGALWRFALGAMIVISFTAATTAVAGLLEFKTAAHLLSATPAIKHARVVIPQPGSAQTILIIGSDHRAGEPQSAANSDTMILVRLDPNSSTINVLSVPRDLRVAIPGGPQVAKINAAYSLGGPNLVVQTIQDNVFPDLHVNHIVDINFAGFRDLVDAMGCVYTDVDHRYFNQNIGTVATDYSSINLQAGYQKLCGEDALSYVRYRHTDTDIVRSARQQDFITEAKDQYGQANLITNRDTLLKIFGEHTQTDPNLHTTDGLINLFNLVAFADGHAIKEVHFPAILLPCNPPSPCYVTADQSAEAFAFYEFMKPTTASSSSNSSSNTSTTPTTTTPAPPPPPPSSHGHGHGHGPQPSADAQLLAQGLEADLTDGQQQASALNAAGVGIPVYFPHDIAYGTQYEPLIAGEYPRAYSIGHYPSYRIVIILNSLLGQYYGVQGTAWNHAPILTHPSEIRYVNGRRLELHFDGHKLRLVAWRWRGNVYWVSNTLSLDLTNTQMIGIAASMTHG